MIWFALSSVARLKLCDRLSSHRKGNHPFMWLLAFVCVCVCVCVVIKELALCINHLIKIVTLIFLNCKMQKKLLVIKLSHSHTTSN